MTEEQIFDLIDSLQLDSQITIQISRIWTFTWTSSSRF